MNKILSLFFKTLSTSLIIIVSANISQAQCDVKETTNWKISYSKEVNGITTSTYKKYKCSCNDNEYIIYGVGDYSYIGTINGVVSSKIDSYSSPIIQKFSKHCNESDEANSIRRNEYEKREKERLKRNKIKDNARYGTFIDKRNNKTYKTTQLADKIWMVENLNYRTINATVYDKDGKNGKTYGQLYNYYDALKACPAGWDLPDKKDWESVNKEEYRPIINLLPGGFKHYGGKYTHLGIYGEYWLSDGSVIRCGFSDGAWSIYSKESTSSTPKATKISIRCVKDK